jgi:hypothetical protein
MVLAAHATGIMKVFFFHLLENVSSSLLPYSSEEIKI